ncbi:uncharacterized protein LY89DRAFT_688413 [Mollisia scopiformis]|uniref:Uncharacterized protein n=1 Tax=Mollisia scopiformis TaxID=149040 RepID=A0A194WVD9_MOLSC|nr:uncharacterized protein LY89DRAFT_688413 [Mollisia scopiformis]KUJ11930.1 hypothetical protein LY89DRAFT_688413 [Mollisia scopiformis]
MCDGPVVIRPFHQTNSNISKPRLTASLRSVVDAVKAKKIPKKEFNFLGAKNDEVQRTDYPMVGSYVDIGIVQAE